MTDAVICGVCGTTYEPSEILAVIGEEAITTLADLRPAPPDENGSSNGIVAKVFTGKARKRSNKREIDLTRFDDLRAYNFECPRGHLVDGNPGESLGIGVLGGSGSSKSHWLAAIVQEMDTLAALRRAGVRLTTALYSNSQLGQNVTKVYEREQQLPATQPGTMGGPFGLKLTVGRRPADPEAKAYAMQLFDVAGEDLAEISKIADHARYIAMCRGLIVLVNPVDFVPTLFDKEPLTERVRLSSGTIIRSGIRAVAETFSELYGVRSPRELEIPICFVIAKADAIQWTGDFDWRDQTDKVVEAATREDGDVGAALQASSNAARTAFERIGGELVIDEVEETFDPSYLRWVAASATSTMPTLDQGSGSSDWVDPPRPSGVALSVLQVLDVAGMVPRPLVEDTV